MKLLYNMRRIVLITCLLLSSTLIYAQLPQIEKDRSGYPKKQSEKQNGQRMQQVQSARIAFFTAELDLTSEEAEVFWPIYNRLWKERETAHKEAQKSLKDISQYVKGEKKLSEAELKVLLLQYVDRNIAIGDVDKRYYNEFVNVIPIDKIARLYKAEEDFRMRMIHQLRRDGKSDKR